MTDSPLPEPTPTIAPKAKGLIARVQDILLRPSPTWDVIATEPGDAKSLYLGYVIPLAAIGPVASAIGQTIFGIGGFGFSWHPPLVSVLSGAVLGFVMTLVIVYVMGMVIDALAPSYDGQKNAVQALKVSAYSMTAAWVVAIVGLFPPLGILGFLGLYNLYLLYRGLPRLMKSPDSKSLGYTIVTIIVGIVLTLITVSITGAVVGGGMMGAGMLGAHRGSVASADGKISGTMKVNGVDVDLGKLQQATDQMAAEASAQQAGTTTVKVVDAQVLLGLMPANFMGAARSDDSTQSGGVAGMTTSQARSSYVINDNTVTLEVADLGSVSGLGAMAAAMNVNSSSSSATGYSRVSTQNGTIITEEYDRESKYGKYSIVRNGRMSVEASGTVDSIDTLKNLVNGVDGGRLDALSKA